MAKRSGPVSVKAVFDAGNVIRNMEALQKQVNALQGKLALARKESKAGASDWKGFGDSLGGVASKVSGFIAAAVSIGSAIGFVKNYAVELDAIGDSAGGLGLTAKELAALRFASEQLGMSADALPKTFINMAKTIGEAKDPLSETGVLFKVLGLNADELKTKNPQEIFFKILDALRQLPTWQQRTEVGAKLLGKSTEEVGKLLGSTNEQIRDQIGLYGKLNPNMEESAKQAGEIDNSMRELKVGLQGLVSDTGILEFWKNLAGAMKTALATAREFFVYMAKQRDSAMGANTKERDDAFIKEQYGIIRQGGFATSTEAEKRQAGAAAQALKSFFERQQAAERAANLARSGAPAATAAKDAEEAARADAFDKKLKAAQDAAEATKKANANEESEAKRHEAEMKKVLEEAKKRAEEIRQAQLDARRAMLGAGVSGAERNLSSFQATSQLDLALGNTTHLEVIQKEVELRTKILDQKAKEATFEALTAKSQADQINALEKLKAIKGERALLGTQAGIDALSAGGDILGKGREALGVLQDTQGRNERAVGAGLMSPAAATASSEAALASFQQRIASLKAELTTLFNAEGLGGDALAAKLKELDNVAADLPPKLSAMQQGAIHLGEAFGQDATQGLSSFFMVALTQPAKAGEAFKQFILQLVTQMLSMIVTMMVATALQSIFTFGANVAAGTAAFSGVTAFLSSAASAAGAMGGIKRARGGIIPGHDTTGRDTVHAQLTEGEYVHKVAAVDYYGEQAMNAINEMLIPRELLQSFKSPAIRAARQIKYASGGAVMGGASGGGFTVLPVAVVGERQADELYRNGPKAHARALRQLGVGGGRK